MGYILKYNDTPLTFNNKFYVVNWEGAGFEDVPITTQLINDGAHIDNFRHSERQIIIKMRVFDETQKQKIYDLFVPRTNGVLTYVPETGESKAKKIDCEITSIVPLQSAFPMDMQIILICAYPFWRFNSVNTELLCGGVGMLEFPLELPKETTFEFGKIKSGNSVIFNYDGSIPTGFAAHVIVYNAVRRIKLYNPYIKQHIEITGDYPENSEFLFSTETGKQKILHRIINTTTYTDITANIMWGSTFFKIVPGSNRIYVELSAGLSSADVSIDYSVKYGGV